MRHSATAEVVIVDLVSGEERVVARTAAWGAQLGAQVQWGATDDFVLFNKIVKQSHSNRAEGSMDSSQYRIAGVQLQLSTLKMTVFPCSIYHVSGDGKMAVTPKMSSMHLSQPVSSRCFCAMFVL